MEGKKKLIINAALADLTNTREETLGAYEEIRINAASVIVSEDVKPLISRYGVRINAASVVGIPSGCKLSTINGEDELTAASAAKEMTALIVNGTLYVSADAEAAVASYEKILINGRMYAPERVRGLSGNIQLNGSACYYPDSYRLKRGDLAVDKLFLLRANEGEKYFITGNLLITGDGMPMEQLLKKNLRFRAQKAYLSEAYADAAALIDEETSVELIPEGYAICTSSLTLSESALLRYGKSVCVLGDFFADRKARPLLDDLHGLFVYGCAKVPEADKDAYLKKLRHFGSLALYKGALIGEDARLEVTRELLGEYEDGITIEDCGAVAISPDVPIELVREKVHAIRDCGSVTCPPELIGILQRRTEDCGFVGVPREPDEMDDEWVSVNTASYAL